MLDNQNDSTENWEDPVCSAVSEGEGESQRGREREIVKGT